MSQSPTEPPAPRAADAALTPPVPRRQAIMAIIVCWLKRAGYDLGSALTVALSLNLGAVIGSIVTDWAGDRFGPVSAGAVAAALVGVALLVLLVSPPVRVVYVVLVRAGVGTHGTQCLIIAAVANHYPNHMRGTALGWAGR